MKAFYVIGALLLAFALIGQSFANSNEDADEKEALDEGLELLAPAAEDAEEFFLSKPIKKSRPSKKPKTTTKATEKPTTKPTTTKATQPTTTTTMTPTTTTTKAPKTTTLAPKPTTTTKKPKKKHSGELNYDGWTSDCFAARAEYYKKHLALYRDFQAKYAALMVAFQKKNAALAAEYKKKRAKVCSKKVVKVISEDDKNWNWAKFSSLFSKGRRAFHKQGGHKKGGKKTGVSRSVSAESGFRHHDTKKGKKKVVAKKPKKPVGKKRVHKKAKKHSGEHYSKETGAAPPADAFLAGDDDIEDEADE